MTLDDIRSTGVFSIGNWEEVVLYHYGSAGLSEIGPLRIVLRELHPSPAVMVLTVTDSGRVNVHPSCFDVRVGNDLHAGISVQTDGTDLEGLQWNLKVAVSRICGFMPPI